jgi:hypothetical protein
MLLDTKIKGRMGSPSVAESTKRLSAGTSPESVSDTARRPTPAANNRRTPLVKLRANRFPSLPNRIFVDHATDLPPFADHRNPRQPTFSDA